MTEHKATPEQWEQVENWADRYSFSCLLELRARVEALEAAAESDYPEGSLVDWVATQILNDILHERESAYIAREVVLKIAAWVDRLGYHSCATELRKEVPQST